MDADEIRFKEQEQAFEERKFQREYALETRKFAISLFTPLILLWLTFAVNNTLQERSAALKRGEQIVTDKKTAYADLGSKLNIFYIYAADVGDFKSYTPAQVIDLKREADKQFHIYRPYWSKDARKKYDDFMNSAFQTYIETGAPAKIKGSRNEKVAAYKNDGREWNSSWDQHFTEKRDPKLRENYYLLIETLLEDTVSPHFHKAANE